MQCVFIYQQRIAVLAEAHAGPEELHIGAWVARHFAQGHALWSPRAFAEVLRHEQADTAKRQVDELSSTDPKKVGELVRNQHVLPGISDGGAHTKFFAGGSFTTDLITWLVRETGELTLEQAHYRLSYLPAQAAGFLDRGFLREGAPADIVVYDFENLRRVPEVDYEVAYDFPANESRRIQRAEGYRWILVNGVVTFKDGVCTNATPGQLLRLNQWQANAVAEPLASAG